MNEPIQFGIRYGERHPDADQIAAFLESALPAHERNAMLAHLAVCPECRTTVALSLPPEERVAAPVMKRPWFAGWRVAWPAGAALALSVAFAVYVRHQAVVRTARSLPVEVARAPEVSELAGRSMAEGAARAAANPPRVKDEKRKSPPPFSVQVTNGAGIDDRKFESVREAPAQKPANALSALGGSVGQNAPVAGALKKTDAIIAVFSLPSGLPVLSTAVRGSQVLAIDSAHGVYWSLDRGEHWAPVPVRWTGRAVKADVATFGAAPESARMQTFDTVARSERVEASASPAIPGQQLDSLAAKQAAPLPVPARREETASGGDQLTGIVTDRSGAAIPGATVTLRDAKDRTTRTALTGADGGYLLPGLAPGTYDLETKARGFAEQRTSAVEVKDARLNVENVTLSVGAMTETVTVDANQAPALETEAMTLPNKVSDKAQASPPPPVFTITTDRGEQWTSANGMTWKRK